MEERWIVRETESERAPCGGGRMGGDQPIKRTEPDSGTTRPSASKKPSSLSASTSNSAAVPDDDDDEP